MKRYFVFVVLCSLIFVGCRYAGKINFTGYHGADVPRSAKMIASDKVGGYETTVFMYYGRFQDVLDSYSLLEYEEVRTEGGVKYRKGDVVIEPVFIDEERTNIVCKIGNL